MKNAAMAARLAALLGASFVEREADGLARAVPESADALALVCRLAHEEGWKLRVEGRGTWLPCDAPADLAISTRALDRIVGISPEDLVATVQAGCTIGTLARALAGHGMWLAIDAPGQAERTIGAILATATAGPLRSGFGPVRDHVLGLTCVTGDGRVVTSGGRVVKNVAGYDLAKLQVGGFGGFGVITEVHLRLRAAPQADVTLLATGERDALTYAARQLVEQGFLPAALELCSPALAAQSAWVLALRLVGTAEGVSADRDALAAATECAWRTLPPEQAAAFWQETARAHLAGEITLRLGVFADSLDETLDLVVAGLGEGLVSAGAGHGTLRWSGAASAETLRRLRRTLAPREIPLTLERAPWAVRSAAGHFGSYREGVGTIVGRLRDTFDPGHVLQVALDGSTGETAGGAHG